MEFSTAILACLAAGLSSSYTRALAVSDLTIGFWMSAVPRLTKCCFFQRFPGRLREKEIDEKHFKRQKTTVDDKVPPADILKANGIDKGSERLRTACKQLKYGDATRTLGVRPELNEKC
jgi:hypothetical protein